jgi:hypothetical protein
VAESVAVGLLIPNLFTRIPVEAAVRERGGEPVALSAIRDAARVGCRLVIVDLGAPTAPRPSEIADVTENGVAVLGFGPHVDAESLAAARHAGAVVMPRGAFLSRLPELLDTALGRRE